MYLYFYFKRLNKCCENEYCLEKKKINGYGPKQLSSYTAHVTRWLRQIAF